ncbi:MAG TPA: T9SS type A sorting domain-containing protein, partial [Saprospiraceae bacterium]|nr:T9SS type A sorting domain-containing protein [Saprospiraceae bacterium]
GEPCMDVTPGIASEEELEFRQPENQVHRTPHVSILADTSEGTFVTAYPNPFDRKLNIQFSTTTHSSWQVRLSQLSGQLILEKELRPDAGEFIYELEIGHIILPGVYLLSITDNHGRR